MTSYRRPFSPLARLIGSLAVAGLFLTAAVSAEEPSREAKVKAAMVYNFVRFSSFTPPIPSPLLTICVTEQNPLSTALQELDGRIVGSTTIRVMRSPPVAELSREACAAMVYTESISTPATPSPAKISSLGILTIGDGDDFLERGGLIRFFREDQKVRFEVNPESARNAGIEISSKVLALAKIWKRKTGGL